MHFRDKYLSKMAGLDFGVKFFDPIMQIDILLFKDEKLLFFEVEDVDVSVVVFTGLCRLKSNILK